MIKIIKRFIRFILDHASIKRITKIYQNGQEFKIVTKDRLGEEWNLISDHDYSEFQLFKKMGKQKINKVFYFGAHQCVIPIKIHKIYLKEADFFCFEAIKKNFLVGKENIKINNCENKIQVFNEALSTINGFDYFDPISLNSYKTKKNIFSKKVKSSDLETIFNRYGKGELIYFDIEGLEGKVIEKNINYLKSWKNNLFIEAHGLNFMKRYDYTNIKLYNLLSNNGYTVYKLNYDRKSNKHEFEKIIETHNIPEERFYMYAYN
jgi:FkbM family methyltransferase